MGTLERAGSCWSRTSRPIPAHRRPRPVRYGYPHKQRKWIRDSHRPSLRRGKADGGCICRVKGSHPMSNSESNFVRVADLKDVAEGTPKAVRAEGRSIALF